MKSPNLNALKKTFVENNINEQTLIGSFNNIIQLMENNKEFVNKTNYTNMLINELILFVSDLIKSNRFEIFIQNEQNTHRYLINYKPMDKIEQFKWEHFDKRILLKRLKQNINKGILKPIDELKILSDYFSLILATNNKNLGRVIYSKAIILLSGIINLTHFRVNIDMQPNGEYQIGFIPVGKQDNQQSEKA